MSTKSIFSIEEIYESIKDEKNLTGAHLGVPGNSKGCGGIIDIALMIPESIVLFVAPLGCARHVTTHTWQREGRVFALALDEAEVVTGAHLKSIEQAVMEIYDYCREKPRLITICGSCIDRLMASDFELVAERLSGEIPARILVTWMDPVIGRKEHCQVRCWDKVYSLWRKSNDKVMAVYAKREFNTSLAEYVDNLNQLLENNPILNTHFTEKNAETLGKDFEKNNLFAAQHTIRLKDGVTEIHSLEEWNSIVKTQLDRLYATPELSTAFLKLKKMLTANNDVSRLRDIIVAHREIIPVLHNIPDLKIQVWLDCFSKLDIPFTDCYERISQYTTRIKALYEQAATQSERWQAVVDEFNRRFRVPFKVQTRPISY